MTHRDTADTSRAPRAEPHGFVTRTIHWLAAGLIGYGYLKGLDSVAQLADPAQFWFEIAVASALGGLFALRLVWTKRVAGATRLPQAAPKWEHLASRFVHAGLYASVFAIVLTGFGIAFGYATPMLGGLFLDMMIALHETSLTLMPLLLLAHVGGALWHKFVRRDAVLESMTGRFSRAPR